MKNLLLLILLSSFCFVLSGCSGTQEDIFYKNVKCYELGRDYYSNLEKKADKNNEIFKDEYLSYSFGMSLYSEKGDTCLLDYTESKTNSDLKRHSTEIILDLLRNKIRGYQYDSAIDEEFTKVKLYMYDLQERSTSFLNKN